MTVDFTYSWCSLPSPTRGYYASNDKFSEPKQLRALPKKFVTVLEPDWFCTVCSERTKSEK